MILKKTYEKLLHEFRSGSADVHGELRNNLDSLFTAQFTGLDELDQELDGRVGTSNVHGFQTNVTGNLLLLFLLTSTERINQTISLMSRHIGHEELFL